MRPKTEDISWRKQRQQMSDEDSGVKLTERSSKHHHGSSLQIGFEQRMRVGMPAKTDLFTKQYKYLEKELRVKSGCIRRSLSKFLHLPYF